MEGDSPCDHLESMAPLPLALWHAGQLLNNWARAKFLCDNR